MLKKELPNNIDDAMKGSYLGPAFSDSEIESELNACGAVFKKCSEN